MHTLNNKNFAGEAGLKHMLAGGRIRLLEMVAKNTGVAILIIMLGWEAPAQSLALHYKIYNTAERTVQDLSAIVDRLKQGDVLFFGEEHNDSVAHYLQDTLYTLLVQKYDRVALSLEMFERDNQIVLDEYLGGLITEQQLVKEGRAWKNYKDYKKPVNTARKYKQAVIAANAPRRYVNSVSRNGLASLKSFPASSQKFFAPLPIDTLNERYAQKFRQVMAGHGSSNSYYAQALWDATMAYSIYEYWKGHKKIKIFHLNGRFHSDEKLGTVSQLQRKNKKLKILNISCFPANDFKSPDWDKYASLGDFIIVTDPAIPRSYQ
ncbi:MAG: ChaN family lipoprotein [Cyclobacteriaceae bacterium]|nr:ChaN family lipoprotein [Cyclobacteriaceae bacterium]